MMKAKMKYRALIVASLTFLSMGRSQACEVLASEPQYYSVDYSKKLIIGYNEFTADKPRGVLINKCKGDRFLMTAYGPDFLNTHGYVNTSYNGYVDDERCEFSNLVAVKQPVSYEEKNRSYAQLTQLLRSCIETRVVDSAGARIAYPEKQPGCKITKLSESTLVMDGGYCFLAPTKSNNLFLSYTFKKECAERGNLISLGMNPQDIPASINVFTASDASGLATDLEHLETVPARFTVQAGPELLPISEDLGPMPRWPTTFVADIEMGQIEVAKAGPGKIRIKAPVVADNRCVKVCKEGLCSSPCDFSTPIAGEMVLTHTNKRGRKVRGDTWYQGGVAYPQWTGVLEGLDYTTQELNAVAGQRFEIEFTMRDPYNDFKNYKGRVRDELSINTSGKVPGRDKLPEIPAIGSVRVIPGVPTFDGVEAEHKVDALDLLMRKFSQALGFTAWPPNYVSFCDASLTKCLPIYRQKYLVKLTTSFTVTEVNGELVTTDVVVKRESPILSNYEKPVAKMAAVTCGLDPSSFDAGSKLKIPAPTAPTK